MSKCPYCFKEFPCGCGGEKERPVAALPLGAELQGGLYRLGRCLGQGGFGITYLAQGTRFGEELCVIKEFFPTTLVMRDTADKRTVQVNRKEDLDLYDQCRKSFHHEAVFMQRHKNLACIPRVDTIFFENNTFYIEMEYIEGHSFQDELNLGKAPYSYRDFYPFAEQILRALGTIHKSGGTHGDVSPSNIFIQKNGRIRLIDFGAARSITRNSTFTPVRVTNLGYSAPEADDPSRALGSVCSTNSN